MEMIVIGSTGRPFRYWKNAENQRKYFEKLAIKLQVHHPKDWGNIRVQTVMKNGGAGLISFHKGSLFKALQFAYSDIDWKKEWFEVRNSRGHWTIAENHRCFIEDLAKRFQIKKPSDWGRISTREILQSGGSSLLSKSPSLLNILQQLYPEIEWKREWFDSFPKGYWNLQNQQLFLKKFAKQHAISVPREWGKITNREINRNGGSALLTFYGGSIFKMLQSVFPEIKWEMNWFTNVPKIPRKYFENINNQITFINNIAQKYQLNTVSDWKRITASLIVKSGGKKLLKKYNGSILQVLSKVFPSLEWNYWDDKGTHSVVSRAQQILFAFLHKLGPQWKIFMNYKHPEIKMELDIWIPEHSLAFEYQGAQHYQQAFRTENDITLSHQIKRDLNRKIACQLKGITLIEIPYWWDERMESLLSTLLSKRPDMKQHIRSEYSISDLSLSIPLRMPLKDKDFITLPNIWSGVGNPVGWEVYEIYEGRFAFFDGEVFRNKSGEKMEVSSSEFEMPKITKVDGVFW